MMAYETVFRALKIAGIDVYTPGQKEGICKSEYVVVKEDGTYPQTGNRLGYTTITVYAYVPLSHYSKLKPFTEKVKRTLSKVPGLRKTGTESPDRVEENYKAHARSIEFITQKTL